MLEGHRSSLSLAAVLGLALAACGSAGAPPASPAAAPPAPAQTFADADPPLAFRDPERLRKLTSVFPRIDEIGEDEVRSQGLPSLALGVVIDGELKYAKGFGGEAGKKPDLDTVYRIGSITKSFTAAALLALRDDGALSLDDPLVRWIPEAAGLVYPTRDAPPITLRQVLTHTSGLPRNGKADGARTDRPLTEAELLSSLAGFPLESPPGMRHLYSNLGFALLGVVVARAGRAPLRGIVDRRVLAPLGMTSTVWDAAAVPAGRLATAYAKGPTGAPTPTPHWLPGAAEGAGGLYSSVRDMARYLAFQLAAYPPRSTPESGPIRRSSVREGHFNALWDSLHVRRSDAPKKGESIIEASAFRYGYGWVVEQTCYIDQLVWHNGGIDGYRADVALLPEHDVGVIALINLGSASPEPIVERILTVLYRSGGLSKRSAAVPPVLAPAMERFLDVYNAWDEGRYKAMLTSGRKVLVSEEKAEIEGYRKLHGACKGYAPLWVKGPRSAVFRMDCERGTLEMDVTLGADGLIDGFAGTSRDLPVPLDLRVAADAVVGLVGRWDDGVFEKHLGRTKRPREEAARYFADLREAHSACTARSLMNVVFDRTIFVSCERGGDLRLSLSVDPNDAEAVTSYTFAGVSYGRCPAR
jgi:CubicO group peptidase (beta-lactamase class C family)